MNEDLELIFISGKFFEIDLPKEKRYLLKYFRSPLQQQFLQYFFTFGNLSKFCEHTGYACNPFWVRDLKKKLEKIENAHAKAKKEMDFETLTLIEIGEFRGKKMNLDSK